MSTAKSGQRVRRRVASRDRASLFAALGDATRLSLVDTLSAGTPQSITRLAEGTALTRQAVTKHLRVLEDVGLVRGVRVGRESVFELRPEPLAAANAYLSEVSAHWESALSRLKAFVER